MDARIEYWIGQDKALAAFVHSNVDVSVFYRGNAGGRYLIAVAPQRLHIRAESEAEGPLLFEAYMDAIEKGLLTHRVDTLMDMSAFVGSFDWDAAAKISALLPWGQSAQNKTAYLFYDRKNVLLLKVLSVMFPGVEHRFFETKEEARQWLGWQ